MSKFRCFALCFAAVVAVMLVADQSKACNGFAVQSFGCQPAFVQSFAVQQFAVQPYYVQPSVQVFAQPSVFVNSGFRHRQRVFVNRGANVQVNAVGADVRVRRGVFGATRIRVR